MRREAPEYVVVATNTTMATPEQVPSDLRRAMFRTAALAFLLATAASLASDFVGPVPGANYPAVWVVSALACAGAAVCWFSPGIALPSNDF